MGQLTLTFNITAKQSEDNVANDRHQLLIEIFFFKRLANQKSR
jgi:hypothetical protein